MHLPGLCGPKASSSASFFLDRGKVHTTTTLVESTSWTFASSTFASRSLRSSKVSGGSECKPASVHGSHSDNHRQINSGFIPILPGFFLIQQYAEGNSDFIAGE